MAEEKAGPQPSPAVLSFAHDLGRLREAAGSPSLKRLAQLTNLGSSTIDDHLSGRRINLPTWNVVRVFVSACHKAAEEDELDTERLGSIRDWEIRYAAARRGEVGPQSPVRELVSVAAQQTQPDEPRQPAEPPHAPDPRRSRSWREWVDAHRGTALALSAVVVLVVAGLVVVLVWPRPVSASKKGHDHQRTDRLTATVAWQHQTSESVDATAEVSGGYLYTADDNGNVYALSASSGQLRWTYRTHGQIDSRPCVVGGIVYVGNDDSKFFAIDAATGRLRWERHFTGGVDSSAAQAGGTLYVGDGNNKVHAISTASGDAAWTYPTNGTVNSSPLVHAGVVYVGSHDGKVYAITAARGRVEWAYQTGGVVLSSPVAANGLVYIGSDNNEILALRSVTAPAGS